MNILVTAIGSFSAKCVITKLKEAGYSVIGTDIYPKEWHLESYLCDKFYQVPKATESKLYIQSLIEICINEGVEIIMPLTDLEIDIINSNRAPFDNHGIILAMPSAETLNTARNKHLLNLFCEVENELQTIPTLKCPLTEISISLPLIAKPIDGRSSEGLKVIESHEELETVKTKSNYIIQKYIQGNIITVDYIRDSSSGKDFAIPRIELLRTKNGAGITVKLINNSTVRKLSSLIGKKLNINGCVNFEFIENSGDYYLIDINPRFSAGVAFSCLAGYNMILAHINAHIGKEIPDPIDFDEQIMVKSHIETTTHIF